MASGFDQRKREKKEKKGAELIRVNSKLTLTPFSLQTGVTCYISNIQLNNLIMYTPK